MKGLILKDFLSIKKELKLFGLAGILYVLFAISTKDVGILAIIGIIASMSAVATSISYDEKANFYSYAKGIMLNPKEIVLSKYALGILIGILSAGIAIIVNLLIKTEIRESMQISLLIIISSILLTSILVPVYLKFGVEKGKFVNIIVILLPTVLVMFFKDELLKYDLDKIMEFLSSYGMMIIGIGAFLICILSIIISVKIYINKEFN